jgi:DNA mismatch repair protein MutL
MADLLPEIRLLDPHTINQIAAGEVVERPAAAVKEMLENALDAGATQVQIDLEDAGRKLIRVSDNGCGMTPDQARLALERHATSKIRRVEDLSVVSSFGFRGEALPSIASVSRMTLSTGVADGLRARFDIEGGHIDGPEAESGPEGTDIAVRDLFANTPARLKFLKTDATEIGQVVEVVSKYALSRPDARITLRHETSGLVQTSGSGDLLTAVSEVWGRDVARALVPVDLFTGAVRVHGFISPPHFTRPTRSQQWMFVNGRPVRSKTLTAALDQACRSITPERRYPVAALFIEVDPARVDVNVSPTKSEVKFHQEGAVFDAIRRAVKTALLDTGMVPTAEGLATATAALREASGLPAMPGYSSWTSASIDAQAPLDLGETTPWPTQANSALPDLLEGLRILGQADKTFIIAENDHAVLIIDQHVAHERVLYEMLRNTRGAGVMEIQRLLTPEPLHVDRRTFELVMPKLGELAELGFEMEPFGTDSFLVRSVPALARGRKPIHMLRDIVDELAGGQVAGCVVPARDEVYILCSCKMAVKAGDPLGHAEMERLVRDLGRTENPYFCPHGRPITIMMPKIDLRRRFKR